MFFFLPFLPLFPPLTSIASCSLLGVTGGSFEGESGGGTQGGGRSGGEGEEGGVGGGV